MNAGFSNFFTEYKIQSTIVLVCDILCCTVMGAMGSHIFYKTI